MHPDTCHLLALHITVYGPSKIPCEARFKSRNVMVRSIHQCSCNYEIANEIPERPDVRWLEAVRGDRVPQVLGGILRIDFLHCE